MDRTCQPRKVQTDSTGDNGESAPPGPEFKKVASIIPKQTAKSRIRQGRGKGKAANVGTRGDDATSRKRTNDSMQNTAVSREDVDKAAVVNVFKPSVEENKKRSEVQKEKESAEAGVDTAATKSTTTTQPNYLVNTGNPSSSSQKMTNVGPMPMKSELNVMPSIIKSLPDPYVESLKKQGNLALLAETNQILELQTILKDRKTDHSDFVFYADRLMRLVIEEGLNRLPYTEVSVTTPTHCTYRGIQFARGNCGLSLCRSGEAMEIALRQCCRSIRICKMLIGGEEQRVLYARMTPDIAQRRVLLLYPIISTGITSSKAVSALKEAGVAEDNVYILTLFITPTGLRRICDTFPRATLVTSDVSQGIPLNFAMKYFGTD